MAYIRIDKDMASDPRLLTLAHEIADAVVITSGAITLEKSVTRNAVCNALLGSLVTLWCYADTHIRNDNTLPIGIDVLADVIGLPVEWLKKFPPEWLVVTPGGVVELPGYCDKNGLISKEKRREQTRERVRRYRDKNAASGNAPGNANVTHPVTHGNAALPDQDQDHTNKNTPKPPKAKSAAKGGSTVMDDQFEIFWKAYPKKTGKGDAIKAWKKLKPDDIALSMILAALAWQVPSSQWTREAGRFIPNPSTYLNQKRWLDEPQVATVSNLTPVGQKSASAASRWLEQEGAPLEKTA